VKLNRRYFSALVAAACLLSMPVASASLPLNLNSQPQAKCPAVRAHCIDTVTVGEKLSITANVTGGDPNVTPTYNWTVSAGTIESGQGTSIIEVSTKELSDGGYITATVDVGGFDRACSTSQSCTATVIKKVEARKLDEYGVIKPEEENKRLDAFMIELQNDPTAQGFIFAYGGRAGRADDAEKAAAKAENYLVSKRGLDAFRLLIIDGGLREQLTVELWIVPSGADMPEPTPTVKPGDTKPTRPKKSGSKKS